MFHPYHCLVNWTNISCSAFPYFQILLDVFVLHFNVFSSCLNALYKLAFFPSAVCVYFFQVHFEVHSQSCESNCQLHCMCAPLLVQNSSTPTEQIFVKYDIMMFVLKSTINHTLLKLDKDNHYLT